MLLSFFSFFIKLLILLILLDPVNIDNSLVLIVIPTIPAFRGVIRCEILSTAHEILRIAMHHSLAASFFCLRRDNRNGRCKALGPCLELRQKLIFCFRDDGNGR